MANQEHLDILNQGVDVWNEWRRKTSDEWFDLSQIDLSETNLFGANLRQGTLRGAFLSRAYLNGAELSWTDLSETKMRKADLRFVHAVNAQFCGADLRDSIFFEANLGEANFYKANLSGVALTNANLNGTILAEADLSNANLREASLVRTNLRGANLVDCFIYGISVWNVKLEEAIQENLIITELGEPKITVDNLEVAQFIYLLLHNQKVRHVIDTITSKVILILGRFTPERKAILDAIRDELRKRNYSPVLFDFEKPASRDITETISTLAHLARFVIADITDAKSIPQELMAIVPNLPSVPIQPLILESQQEYGMFEHFTRFPWVLPVYQYIDQACLLQSLNEHIIEPAERTVQELAKR
jgi:uncharacterized protein YjbI with pentapeptide repeats